MKRILILIAGCVLAIHTNAQYIKDKNAFANAFIKIFNQRANGFDSLAAVQGDDDTLKEPYKILPQTHECYVSMNSVFGGRYVFPDSIKAVNFFKELQELLRYSAGAYSADVVFEPLYADPFYLQFYFRDAESYTENLMTISMSAIEEGKNAETEDGDDEEPDEAAVRNTPSKEKEFEVLLLIHPGDEMSYVTSAGAKINDDAVSAFINKMAFGTDTMLTQYKANKRTDQQKNIIYDSKINLKGFSTTITEVAGKKVTAIHITAFRNYSSPSWENFRSTLDSFLLKMKAAVPADYSYRIYADDNFIEFKPARFAHYNEGVASIAIKYSLLQNKKNTYRLELEITRTCHSVATNAKQNTKLVTESPALSSEKYLNENKKKAGVITTASGLQYFILKKGNGATPDENDECEFYTKGTLLNGNEFDNTFKTKKPITGMTGAFIRGLQEGLQLMPVGSTYRFYIPSALGFGEEQAGSIPAGSVLIYEVELIGVKRH
jgi:FKBP-type peptidyl-prolyl cis-trans isomerase